MCFQVKIVASLAICNPGHGRINSKKLQGFGQKGLSRMDSYPAQNAPLYNGQIGSSIGPIKFETEPYHSDVSNNNNQNYGYDSSGIYGQTYQQTGYQYNPATQGTVPTDAQTQNLYTSQNPQHAAVNGDAFNTPKQANINKNLNSGGDHHCDVCEKVFSSGASLRRHKEIHSGIKKFSCKLCGNSYTQKHNLTKHMRLHTGEKPYKCHLCEKSFYILHHLKNHMFQHTGELPYKCPKCTKSFKHKFRFDRHLLTHEEGTNTDGSVAQTPPSVVTSEDNSMSEVWNNGTEEENNGDDFYDPSMYDSFDEEENRYDEHECEVCQQIFISKESLDNHFKQQHAVDREFKCDDCSSIFLTRAHLVRHRRTHTGEQIYECEECNVSFRWKVSLHIHMRRHNNDYKKYTCTKCNKYFLAKESLKKHMNMHLGTITYDCEECEEQFTSKNEYRDHLQTHSDSVDSVKNVEEKVTAKADEEKKKTSRSAPKARPTCKTCFKAFSSNSSLRKHEFTHMDVKPHKCDICNVSFAQKIQLRLHNKKHNGGKMDPPLFYRKKEPQVVKKEEPVKEEVLDESDTKDDRSPVKHKSPVKNDSPGKVTPVRIRIDKSKIIPERRNAPRKARNVIKEVDDDDDMDDETSEEEESDTESETPEEDHKKSRWEGYRYPVCEHCHKVFKKRRALDRHQKFCKRKE